MHGLPAGCTTSIVLLVLLSGAYAAGILICNYLCCRNLTLFLSESWHAPRQFPVVQGSCQSAGATADAPQNVAKRVKMSSSAQKGLCDYEVRLCDCIAMPAGMWHADLRELADQEGPVLKRRRQSRGSLQAEASVCTCQADGYGAGNRELQCSLAHASMLEAGTCTARLPACSSDHTGGAHVPQSLQACHEKCLRPSWRVSA